MIHSFDTHFWLARLPDGSWISAEDHSSADPIFQQATKIRIEPLSQVSIQAILEAEVPQGYTTFLRTDIHRRLSGELARLGYILALERGVYPDRGSLNLSELPVVDGFRAELQCWDGVVDFVSSPNFNHQILQEDGKDLYRFVLILR